MLVLVRVGDDEVEVLPPTAPRAAVPQAIWLRLGESYLGAGYGVWQQHLHRTVRVAAVQGEGALAVPIATESSAPPSCPRCGVAMRAGEMQVRSPWWSAALGSVLSALWFREHQAAPWQRWLAPYAPRAIWRCAECGGGWVP